MALMQEFLLDNLFWLITASAAAGGLVWTFIQGGRLTLSPQAAILAVSRGGGVFLDIRPAADFSTGHIPKSQNLPGGATERLSAIAKFKQKPVVLVCPTGQQARKTAATLVQEGFAQVHVLAGGIAGWREANLPLFNRKEKK